MTAQTDELIPEGTEVVVPLGGCVTGESRIGTVTGFLCDYYKVKLATPYKGRKTMDVRRDLVKVAQLPLPDLGEPPHPKKGRKTGDQKLRGRRGILCGSGG